MATCKFCGREMRPGPLVNHERACSENPDRGLTVSQPEAECRYCGRKSTAGAIATHEKYGCEENPSRQTLTRG